MSLFHPPDSSSWTKVMRDVRAEDCLCPITSGQPCFLHLLAEIPALAHGFY